MITFLPFFWGCIIVISLVICKYYNSPKVLLIFIIMSSFFYQVVTNRKNNKVYDIDEVLINISQFIIISGIMGYLVVKIIGHLLSGFD